MKLVQLFSRVLRNCYIQEYDMGTFPYKVTRLMDLFGGVVDDPVYTSTLRIGDKVYDMGDAAMFRPPDFDKRIKGVRYGP